MEPIIKLWKRWNFEDPQYLAIKEVLKTKYKVFESDPKFPTGVGWLRGRTSSGRILVTRAYVDIAMLKESPGPKSFTWDPNLDKGWRSETIQVLNLNKDPMASVMIRTFINQGWQLFTESVANPKEKSFAV